MPLITPDVFWKLSYLVEVEAPTFRAMAIIPLFFKCGAQEVRKYLQTVVLPSDASLTAIIV